MLTSHALLIADGWEHVSNVGSMDEAESLKRQLELNADAYEYQIGKPKGGLKYTAMMLESMCFVGLYRRGGRTVPSIPGYTPSLPIFSDDPYKPPQTTPPGQPHDRPLKPVCA